MKKIYEAPEMKMTKISVREDILVNSTNEKSISRFDLSAANFWGAE